MILLEGFKWMALIWVCLSLTQEILIMYFIKVYDYIMVNIPFLLCQKCMTFWFTWMFSQDIYLAAIASMMAYFFDVYIPHKTKL